MAGEEGLEPPNARTKTWCLTTWPLPNTYERYYKLLAICVRVLVQDLLFDLLALRAQTAGTLLLGRSLHKH